MLRMRLRFAKVVGSRLEGRLLIVCFPARSNMYARRVCEAFAGRPRSGATPTEPARSSPLGTFTTGAFPCDAAAAGIRRPPDLAQRACAANVNAHGCRYPASVPQATNHARRAVDTRNDTVNKFVGEPKSPPPGIVRTAALGHGRSGPQRGKRPRPGVRAEVLSLSWARLRLL